MSEYLDSTDEATDSSCGQSGGDGGDNRLKAVTAKEVKGRELCGKIGFCLVINSTELM